MLKRFLFLMAMVGAVAVPYLLTTSPDWWNSLTSTSTDAKDAKHTSSLARFAPNKPTPGFNTSGRTTTAGLTTPAGTESTPSIDLSEVLQFDGTPAWVMTRWPRVTSGLSEVDLQGYRVALVSGTAEDDIAGSLSYYFDKSQRIAYINFHGTTGDPRKLVTLLTSRYRFVPQQAADPGLHLYQIKWNGKPHSELRIRSARIVRADQPHSRYEVDLAMKRP